MRPSPAIDERSEVLRDLRDLLIPLLGGTHLGFCFHSPVIAWTAPLGLAGLAYAARIRSRSVASLSAFAGLFAFHLIGLRFLHQTGHREIGLWWPWLSVGLAAVSLCYLPVTRLLVDRTRMNVVWAFPVAWLAAEQLRFWATVPFLDVSFPFLRAGATLYQSDSLLQCADFVGEAGLSGLVALFAASIADWLQQATRPEDALPHVLHRTFKIGFIGMCLFGYGIAREFRVEVEPGPTVALIPDLIPASVVNDDVQMRQYAERLAKWRSKADADGVDLWVWSEMSLTVPLEISGKTDADRQRWERLQSLAHRVGGSLLFGAPRLSSQARHNSCFLVSAEGDIPQFYDKTFLGPGDEFQPRLGRILSALTGHSHLTPQSLNWAVHLPGDATPIIPVSAVSKKRLRFMGCSICFDVWFSDLFRRYMQQPESPTPDFFVNIADEVFTGDREFSYAHWALVAARLRAIETRRSLVRCCGDGYTAIIAPTGRIMMMRGGASTQKHVLIGNVPVSSASSLYAVAGDVLPLCALLVFVGVLFVTLTACRLPQRTGPIAECLPPLGYDDLSVIIPAFNEVASIRPVLTRIRDVAPESEIIVVDDGSSDGTERAFEDLRAPLRLRVFHHAVNQGKGAAIRTGLQYASRRFLLIQDADLEYDPVDYARLLEPLRGGQVCAVYGSRYLPDPGCASSGGHRRLLDTGVRLLNLAVRMLYGVRLTDEATCYKILPTELLRSLDLQCQRFEFCPEVTAKLCRMGIPIVEVPISYRPRTSREGKKLRLRDGWAALRTLWRWRRWTPSLCPPDSVWKLSARAAVPEVEHVRQA